VRRLIAAHVNIDCTPYQDGWTPLIRASCNGHVDIVRLLVDAKAQVNRQTEDGATPLYVASQNGHSEVVNILIRNGADINQPGPQY
jgi:ankyrin repeat protein